MSLLRDAHLPQRHDAVLPKRTVLPGCSCVRPWTGVLEPRVGGLELLHYLLLSNFCFLVKDADARPTRKNPIISPCGFPSYSRRRSIQSCIDRRSDAPTDCPPVRLTEVYRLPGTQTLRIVCTGIVPLQDSYRYDYDHDQNTSAGRENHSSWDSIVIRILCMDERSGRGARAALGYFICHCYGLPAFLGFNILFNTVQECRFPRFVPLASIRRS
jgi:hypothetical protein